MILRFPQQRNLAIALISVSFAALVPLFSAFALDCPDCLPGVRPTLFVPANQIQYINNPGSLPGRFAMGLGGVRLSAEEYATLQRSLRDINQLRSQGRLDVQPDPTARDPRLRLPDGTETTDKMRIREELDRLLRGQAPGQQPPQPNTELCVVVTPGQSKTSVINTGPFGPEDYGWTHRNPFNTSPPPDTYPELRRVESDLNFRLRTTTNAISGNNYLTLNMQIDLASNAATRGGGRIKRMIIPNRAQAQEFVDSGFKSYTVEGGAKVQPGAYPSKTRQRVNSQGGLPRPGTPPAGEYAQISENCAFTPTQAPQNPNNFNQPPNPNDYGGGGSGGGGSGGGAGGLLSQLLPALLQSLLGQQGQQQGGQQGQQPIQHQQPAACTQEYAPVCGRDGNTYPSTCVATRQFGIQVAHNGACAPVSTPTSKAVPQASIDRLFQKAKQSGVPERAFEHVVQSLTTIILRMVQESTTLPETVVR